MKEPKIRFKGFEGEWETSAIGDLASFSKGRGYSKSDLKNNGYPIILYGRMYTDYSFVIDSVDTFATLQKGSVLSNGDEVVIPASGETPEDIAVASAVTMKNVILGGDLNILKFDKNKIFSTFAAMQISCGRTRKELSSFAQGKTVVHLHNSNISKGHFCYPPISEQQSIASFFTTIDAQISASTSRLASLKQIKAASLQAMFPKEGETVPKLRFKGFEGEWEKVSFLSLFDILKNNSLTRAELNGVEGDVICIHYGDVLIKYGDLLDVNNEEVCFISDAKKANILYSNSPLKEGDVIIADAAEDSTVGKCVELINISEMKVVAGLHTIPCRPKLKMAAGFIGHYLNSSAYHNQLLPLIQGTKISSISKKTLSLTYLMRPSFSEQQSIASYLTNLDRQITLQTNRLEKLKQIKAACLDKMFV